MHDAWSLYSQTDSLFGFQILLCLTGILFILFLFSKKKLRTVLGFMTMISLAGSTLFFLPFVDVLQGTNSARHLNKESLAGLYRLNHTLIELSGDGRVTLRHPAGELESNNTVYKGHWYQDQASGSVSIDFKDRSFGGHYSNLPLIGRSLVDSRIRIYDCRSLEYCSPYVKD